MHVLNDLVLQRRNRRYRASCTCGWSIVADAEAVASMVWFAHSIQESFNSVAEAFKKATEALKKNDEIRRSL